MKNILPKALFYYSALASLVIVAVTIFISSKEEIIIFGMLFLPVAAYFISELVIPKPAEENMESRSKRSGFMFVSIIFLLLFGIGIRNVNVSAAKIPVPSSISISDESNYPTATPLAKITEDPSATIATVLLESVKPKSMLVIKSNGQSIGANIREGPSDDTALIGVTKDGEVFEFVAFDPKWYQVVLANGSVGFISAGSIEVITN